MAARGKRAKGPREMHVALVVVAGARVCLGEQRSARNKIRSGERAQKRAHLAQAVSLVVANGAAKTRLRSHSIGKSTFVAALKVPSPFGGSNVTGRQGIARAADGRERGARRRLGLCSCAST